MVLLITTAAGAQKLRPASLIGSSKYHFDRRFGLRARAMS